ncbi:MAG: porphobilinogen synthase [Solirubrobacterales bacterium]
MSFPRHRMRRLRTNEGIRRLVRETLVVPSNLIYPIFVVPGTGVREPVSSMPGVERYSADLLPGIAREARNKGIGGVLLFGIPEHKDAVGASSFEADGVVQHAVKTIKDTVPDLTVVTDVCLCEYTDHGHCGVLTADGMVDNDMTLPLLAKQACSHARAGADIIAPSDMMDGRIGYIRTALDECGFESTLILSYAVKYASAFYGPFRDAAESAPKHGDRKTYQMDPPNAREAIREAALDIEEGADMIMVKPALAYLDIIREVKERFHHPVVAYNVSGEYAMVKAAGRAGWIDETRVTQEILTAIKRAGADIIITYHALEMAEML